MAEPKKLLAKNVLAEDVKDMIEAFKKLGATDITKTENPDGTFNLEGKFPD